MSVVYLQPLRSRKGQLVPLRDDLDNEMKIEIVDFGHMSEYGLMEVEPDHILEVITSSSSASSVADEDENCGNPKPRKRAKLDHMSADEKAQHRKMMNRISAQSARDRQKALMGQQEIVIKSISNQNSVLKQQTETLKKENSELKETVKDLTVKHDTLSENNERLSTLVKELEEKLKEQTRINAEREQKIKTEVYVQESKVSCSSLEPAVPSTVPLPKGLDLLQTYTLLLIMWTFFLLISKRRNSYKLLNTFQKKSSAMTLTTSNCQTSIKLSPQKDIVKNSWNQPNQMWDPQKVKNPG